jgi:predicted Fe-S protein YdhL (DUF1289 family)
MRLPVLLHQYDIMICAASATAAANLATRHSCYAGNNKGAMDQLELFDLPNPCVGICQSNNRGYCVGCLRSRDERFNWHQKPVAERAKILKLLENRRIRRDAARLAGKPDQGLEADPTPDLFDF